MRKRFMVILLGVIVVVLASCGETIVAEKSTDGTAQEQPDTTQVFQVGDTVTMGTSKFTVNSVRLSLGQDFMGPEAGNVFIVADCTLENIGEEPLNSSSLMMYSVQDSQGYKYDIGLNTEAKGSLDGEVAPGRILRGEISFEVPENATGLDLIFEPGIFDRGQAIFSIGDVASLQ